MSPKPEIFHKGDAVQPEPAGVEQVEVSEKARAALEKLFNAVEKEGKTPYLIFDLDGTLFPYGQESDFNPVTIQEYVTQNSDLVDTFKRRINSLARYGFRTAINTGRPVHFAQKAAKQLFPKGSVETIIGENGALLAKREGEKDATETEILYPSYFDKGQSASFRNQCEPIIQLARSLGGFISSEGHLVGIIFFPKDVGIPGEAAEKRRKEFLTTMKQEIETRGLGDEIEVHYPGSVDLTPKGVTKAHTAEEILGDNVGIYFGDSQSDEEAMSNVAVNVVPGNAFASTKAQARKAEIGLLAEQHDLKGVLDSLSMIEAYIRMRNIKKIRKAKEEGGVDRGE